MPPSVIRAAEALRAAQAELDEEAYRAAVEAEKARLRARSQLTWAQRLTHWLPFTITFHWKSK